MSYRDTEPDLPPEAPNLCARCGEVIYWQPSPPDELGRPTSRGQWKHADGDRGHPAWLAAKL